MKIGNLDISSFKLGTNYVSIYLGDAKLYPTAQTPCYDVINTSITSYTGSSSDVYSSSADKWYKRNNLNQYEEYGVYATSTGSTSRLPSAYTEVEYIRNSNYNAYINTNVIIFDNTANTYTVTTKLTSEFHSNLGCATIINCEYPRSPYYGFGYRYKCSSTVDQLEFFGGTPNYSASTVENSDGTKTITFQSTATTTYTTNTPLTYFCSFSNDTTYTTPSRFADATIYSATVVKNGVTIRDFVPAKRNSDSVYGLYDLVDNVFYTSPNGNNFSGGSEITPEVVTYYEGKLAIVDGYEYMYSGNSWVNIGEVSGSTATLPNVPFSVNYNANHYNANTKTLAKTSGQLVDTDAVITAGTPTVHVGYLTIASGTRATISGYQEYFNRNTRNPNITIISKQRTDGSNCHMFSNRDTNYNWMYRCYATKLTLHGSSERGNVAVTTQPVIESVRVDSQSNVTYNNYTDNASSTTSLFTYGSTNSGNFAMFQGYATNTGENFVGDFYWVYMSQNTLTDAQIQEVIAYNEVGGGQIYPMYYAEKQDPPQNLIFSSMAEALAYECPYVGLYATIGGDLYVFNSSYQWEQVS